jgi:hypothetical protein
VLLFGASDYIHIVLNRNDTTDNLGGKEKLLLSQECELVTLMSRVKGRLDITNTHVSFNEMSPAKEEADRFDFKVSVETVNKKSPADIINHIGIFVFLAIRSY